LFKSAGVVPNYEVILAGAGPLLLLLAWQYMNVDVNIKAILEVTPLSNHFLALPINIVEKDRLDVRVTGFW